MAVWLLRERYEGLHEGLRAVRDELVVLTVFVKR